MIDIITGTDLRRLAETDLGDVVSLFLPTHRVGSDRQQDPVRLKNLLGLAGDELTALGHPPAEVERLLAPAAALIGDTGFWAHQAEALAVYLAPGSMERFRLAHPVDELVVVGDRFHVKPLLPAVAAGRTFHLLALSRHDARLLRGDAITMTEIGVGELPAGVDEIVRWDDRERQVQSHGADRVGRGRVTATFHGHGAAKDTSKDDLARYLRAVDRAVGHLVAGDAPLVLAGVDEVVAAYRSVSHHRRIAPGAVDGNPEHLGPEELHRRAWPIVEPILDEERRAAVEGFVAGARTTATATAEIVAAATAGRVETLFAPLGVHRWGKVDTGSSAVVEHEEREPGDRDLFDLAAIDTLLHHGTVHAVAPDELPGDGPLAAVLRF